jgi:hypothetical protein
MQKFVSDGCVLLLLLPLYKYKLKLICNVNRRRTRGRQQNTIKGLEEENGPPDEDVNAIEVFKDFHTDSKKGHERCCKSSSYKYLLLLS